MKLLEHLLVALRNFRGYDCRVHPHGELVLAGYKDNIGAQSVRAIFVREISMRSHVMAGLERDIFGCVGFLCHQPATLFSLATQLAVSGKASIKNIGAH